MLIERVLIHPLHNGTEVSNFSELWKQWENLPTTKIIPLGDLHSLAKTNYLEHVQRNLIVGGQSGGVCVYNHLIHLARDSRVKEGEISIDLSWEATLISEETLHYIVRRILAEQHVVINIVK